jgi:hypothetical protein
VRYDSTPHPNPHPPSFTLTGPGSALLRSHSPAAYRRWAVPNMPQLQAAADAAASAKSSAAASMAAVTAAAARGQGVGVGVGGGVEVVLGREGLGKRLRRRLWR